MPVSSGGFPQAIRVLRYSGTVTRKMRSFRLRVYYPLGLCFPADSTTNAFCNFLLVKDRRYRPTTPPVQARVVWALPVSLAATQGIQFVSVPLGTEMFHFPRYASDIAIRSHGFAMRGFPIRTPPDQRLLGTSPKLIAAAPRPSSPHRTKASTIRP